ncbi:hypothetical protein GCM10010361_18990 [Streptomyces olivaceiscleroticus]|uniref:Uncharacterized protein n=1 Tax=Streptomyces olivaceiscleroticus TaxID=68245 RepID=A0ABN0ZQR2_9ACTN
MTYPHDSAPVPGPQPPQAPYDAGYAPYGQGPPPQPGYDDRPRERYRRPRDGAGAARTALIVHTIADIAAAFLVLWILLYLLGANRANVFVDFVESVAGGFAWWSQDIFTMDTEGLRVVLDHGLPAVIYLLVGHGIAARIRRL